MRDTGRKLILLGLVAALVYGGLKASMYLQARRMANDLVVELSPRAEVTYAGIDTGLEGVVAVTGIQVRPLPYRDAIRIDRVAVTGFSPLYFLQRLIGVDQALPDNLNVRIHNARVGLDSDVIAALEQQIAERTAEQARPGACEYQGGVDVAMLRKLGFEQIAMDLNGGYRFPPAGGDGMHAFVGVEIFDMESVEMSVDLAEISRQAVEEQRQQLPALKKAQFGVTLFPEFGERYAKHCAEQRGLGVSEYKQALQKELQQGLAQGGLTLGIGLSTAVRRFYDKWGSITVTLRPEKPMGAMSMMFMPPDQLFEALNPELVVNEQLITDLSFEWSAQQGNGLPGLLGVEEEGKAAPPRRPRYRKEYQRIALNGLGDYVGKRVRLDVAGQPLREGILDRVANGEVTVIQRTDGGVFSAHVPTDTIKVAEVEVLVKIEDGEGNKSP